MEPLLKYIAVYITAIFSYSFFKVVFEEELKAMSKAPAIKNICFIVMVLSVAVLTYVLPESKHVWVIAALGCYTVAGYTLMKHKK